MTHDPIVIVSIARTPIGNLLGELKSFSATQLGSIAIKAALIRSQLQPTEINEVYMGCVLPAGLGQAPARQAARVAGLADSTAATTINKVCGSGMKAIMCAHDAISLNQANICIAGGMESMSNAPYLLTQAREGYRLGHHPIYDHMMLDGLEDAYDAGKAMGYFAEQCVKHYQFTRAQQDDYASASFAKAMDATKQQKFSQEIIAITRETKQGSITISQDEHPFSVKPEKIPALKPVFIKDGTVTAGNASSIADGAAALVLMRASDAKQRGIKPFAQIVGFTTHAKQPSEFTTAPIDATKKLLAKINWSLDDVDLFEINEAFAVVALAFMKELNIPAKKINIHGGACALGHPIGASGARIVITLLAALQQNQLSKGIATLCIGGGEATALAIEMIK